MRVEYLRAWEDGHWDTEIHEIPEDQLVKCTEAGDDENTLGIWARAYLMPQTQYRRVVLWAVYAVLDA